jgi:hypothetical protein
LRVSRNCSSSNRVRFALADKASAGKSFAILLLHGARQGLFAPLVASRSVAGAMVMVGRSRSRLTPLTVAQLSERRLVGKDRQRQHGDSANYSYR